MLVLYFAETGNDFYGIQYLYSIKMKSPPKRPIVTSDNYQVTLTVIPNKLFMLSKQMFEVLPISFHRGALQSTPLVNCFVDDMLQQISNVYYGRVADTLLHDSQTLQTTVHWIRVWARPETGCPSSVHIKRDVDCVQVLF